MMSDARTGAFDALVFFDLDRFGRDAQKGMNALSDLLDLGVSVWDFSTSQRVELDSLEGEMSATMAKVEAALQRPRPQRPDADKARVALLQRAGEWRETLRAEPKVARLVLRRMLGSLTLSGAARPAFVKWDAPVKPGILEGIVPTDLVASPRGFEPVPSQQPRLWSWYSSSSSPPVPFLLTSCN